MRKIFSVVAIFIVILLTTTKQIHAASGLDFEWGKTIGGSAVDTGVAFTSPSGEVYLAGYFSGTMDVDPTSTTDNRISTGGYDVFISKYDSAGNYVWTKTWGGNNATYGDSIHQLTWDTDGNMYILGGYGGTADLNPETGVDNFTAAGSLDSFLTKYDASGNYVWTKTWGGAAVERASVIMFDSLKNIYIVGEFQGTADFDLSPSATSNHTSNGNYDAYLTKLDSSSNYLWTKTWGSSGGMDKAFAIKSDSSGNYYIAGGFTNTVDFDPSGATSQSSVVGGTYYDGFLVKYNSNDEYVWTKTWGTTGDDWCAFADCIVIDSSNNLYLTGYAGGNIGSTTIDLDPGSGVDTRNLSGSGDVVLMKLTQNGDYVWGKTFGGTSLDLGWGLNMDSHNLLYLSGWYNGTADFNPTGQVNSFTSNGGTEIFISKFDLDGNYYFTKSIGGTSSDRPQKISIYGDSLYMGGFSTGIIDMDPDAGVTNSTSYGSVDVLFIKFTIDVDGPATFSFVSPVSFIRDSRPSLVFKKSSDVGSEISSYTVALDTDKHQNWMTSGIPASNNASQSISTWKDDDNVKIEFAHENDSDTGNDEIRVYFKDLSANELSEGEHSWRLTATDTEGNSSQQIKDFYIDKHSPSIQNLAIANISSITDGSEYVIDDDERLIAISGLVVDSYYGSTKTFDGGIDIFEKVAAGPRNVTLTISKLKNDDKLDLNNSSSYEDFFTKVYGLTNIKDTQDISKEASFYGKISHPLTDGYYKVTVTVDDTLGSSYEHKPFYLIVNYQKTTSVGNVTDNDNSESNVDNPASPMKNEEIEKLSAKLTEVLKIDPSKKIVVTKVIGIGLIIFILIFILLWYKKRNK